MQTALFRSKKLVACLGLALATASVYAKENSYAQHPLTAPFIEEMSTEFGFLPEPLQAIFTDAERKQVILDAISRPAERVKQWKDYRPIFITQARVDKGLEFWAKNQEALQRAEQEYGVPAEFIVAIIGVETIYGGNTGSYRVIDALSTLAFDYPPRAPFFRQQLKEYLLLTREEQVDPLSLKGSYAGAMGLPQFMPGSFRAYAVDFDHDGHIDIWQNPTDAVGSVANYFIKHGWKPGQPVVVRADLKAVAVAEKGLSDSLDPKITVKQLQKLGWTPRSALDAKQKVTAFRLEAEQGNEYWIGLANFHAITRYNRSVMYAMAVNELAELLVAARKD
ncbi:MAG: lytic murein transglycosylase B [Thiopseudomonas sp.]|jgi:membrane-bound lytic murein transglycosylase B|uniref:lytic murein transglycosylase B n=1 Tax=Denitrificimonas caeni TaxID=521720 RepID=UPI0003B5456C|nr:lytic murein transglycosylase B [Denitrificimonas caeni]MBP7188589.1 lytic murein transglycosylase B [Thiopseudomonas sp.]HAB92098.1 lytic murein transglycosylase B [Pseudomonas sp.]MBP7958460.1 lytic murein transglycosylase B [Thiopseudomonas sp.]MBP8007650.1 lytic murein transglycosylase B [Thiopseudomonas sp.]MBP8770424.1 lytic murein transglycosylase B [Thiopseudomonas sp.]